MLLVLFGSNRPSRSAGIVGARRGEVLMPALHADRRGQRRELQVDRRELDLDAAFLLLVGEGLPDAVGRGIGRIGKADLVVLVVAVAAPEPDGVDRRRLARAIRLCSVSLV